MANVQWIKITTDIFDNRKIKQIENMPDGDALVVIWLKLLILAGNINDGGCVYFTKDIPFTDQLLATEFNRPIATIQLALTTFERFGMIEIVDDVIFVSNWERYQNIEGMDRIREQTRKRVAKHREKQRLLQGNVTVTQGNATDKNRKDKNRKEEDKKTSFDSIIDDFTDNEELRKIILEFIKMRKLIKKPMVSDRALTLMLNRLKELSDDPETQIAILDQSILHNWQTVYALKKDYKPSGRVGANGVKLTEDKSDILDDIL